MSLVTPLGSPLLFLLHKAILHLPNRKGTKKSCQIFSPPKRTYKANIKSKNFPIYIQVKFPTILYLNLYKLIK